MADLDDAIIKGIDEHLPHLHKERWAIEHAKLRRAAGQATGEDQARAKQALQDHYATMDDPESSRIPLIEEARLAQLRRTHPEAPEGQQQSRGRSR